MAPETIGLIGGTGKEGQGIALRLTAAGHAVRIGSRDAGRAKEIVAALRERGGTGIEGDANRAVVESSDVNILSVPFRHAGETIDELRDAFRPGSLLIDVTVPVRFAAGRAHYEQVPEGSAAAHIRERLPAHVALAGALKTLPAHLLGRPEEPLECDTFVCGDSQESRDRTIRILERIPGLRAVDVGDLDAAAALERMTVLLININRRYKIHDGRFRIVGL